MSEYQHQDKGLALASRRAPASQPQSAVWAPAEADQRAMAALAHRRRAMDSQVLTPDAVLALQRTVGNTMVNRLLHQQSATPAAAPGLAGPGAAAGAASAIVQRTLAGDTDHAAVARLLTDPTYSAIFQQLAATDVVTLRFDADARDLAGAGNTALTLVGGAVVPPGNLTVNTIQALVHAAHVTITVKLLPQGEADMISTLMHEVTLHILPIIHNIHSFRAKLGTVPGHSGSLQELQERIHRADAGENIAHIFHGEALQHSDPERLEAYLAAAVDMGRRLKQQGSLASIKLGSEIIASTVNDVMTLTWPEKAGTPEDRSPQLSLENKQRLFDQANAIGTVETQYQDAHPEIFGSDSDESQSESEHNDV